MLARNANSVMKSNLVFIYLFTLEENETDDVKNFACEQVY